MGESDWVKRIGFQLQETLPLRLRSRRLCELMAVAGLRSVPEYSEISRIQVL